MRVRDRALVSGFQDYSDNHYRRGRSIIADDFDGDGRVDYFVGNPADESIVFRNLGLRDGVVKFGPALVLLEGDLAFVASGSDYDNDGDLDLFVGCGGREGACFDFLFRNDSTPGHISFTDVSIQAGIRGPAPEGFPLGLPTAGGTWGDYDLDGDQDLFVSVNGREYRKVLWANNGDGTFTDATSLTHLDGDDSPDGEPTPLDRFYFQNSTWIDVDNDGDLDLFVNNAWGPNFLWKNLLVEQGQALFVEATSDFSLPGEDLHYPVSSFASAVADFNNDGWQDLMLFASSSVGANGNGLYLNHRGQGFWNAASMAGVNTENGETVDAMGCQVADLNGDGIPDLAIGTGVPGIGKKNRLLLSERMTGATPLFADASHLIDFEASHGIDPTLPPDPEIPPYPYRTHGIVAADFDGDGRLDLGMVNGGKAADPAIVREPNRLFDFAGQGFARTFRVRLEGNGISDSRDAIGSRAYVEIKGPEGLRRVFQTVLGGSGFSSQNERTLTFGLGSDRVSRLAILWSSGCMQVLETHTGTTISPLVVAQRCWTCPEAPGPVEAWLDPESYGCSRPSAAVTSAEQ